MATWNPTFLSVGHEKGSSSSQNVVDSTTSSKTGTGTKTTSGTSTKTGTNTQTTTGTDTGTSTKTGTNTQHTTGTTGETSTKTGANSQTSSDLVTLTEDAGGQVSFTVPIRGGLFCDNPSPVCPAT